MSGGFTWGTYVTDDGRPFSLRVNDTYFSAEERGWTGADGFGYFPLPRQWLPRRVIGIDLDGHPQTAIAATLESLIWTGESSSFAVLGNDGALVVCTVIGRLAEDLTRAPAAAALTAQRRGPRS
jgi:hypothetical protein